LTRGDAERLADIAGAIETIRRHVASSVPEDVRRDAILYNLVVIGEGVKLLSEDTKSRRPEIPWRRIAGLRDVLAHEYYRVDMAEVQKIVDHDLDPLFDAIAALRRAPRK
jgi:uncharacterized protein with HEPN domain